jgi:hypothetical protein
LRPLAQVTLEIAAHAGDAFITIAPRRQFESDEARHETEDEARVVVAGRPDGGIDRIAHDRRLARRARPGWLRTKKAPGHESRRGRAPPHIKPAVLAVPSGSLHRCFLLRSVPVFIAWHAALTRGCYRG